MIGLFHRIITGHFPLFEVFGYDRYGFEERGDVCLICGKNKGENK